jgi:hypothetical protein
VGNYSGKSVGPRAGLLKSHSPWYRRIQAYTCRQAQEREINLTTAFSSRKRCGLHASATARRSSQVHGDQTGRDGGTKKVKEENEPLDDLGHNEDGRGCCHQPLLKTNPEAADRSPSRSADVLRDLMRRAVSHWHAVPRLAATGTRPGPEPPGCQYSPLGAGNSPSGSWHAPRRPGDLLVSSSTSSRLTVGSLRRLRAGSHCNAALPVGTEALRRRQSESTAMVGCAAGRLVSPRHRQHPSLEG